MVPAREPGSHHTRYNHAATDESEAPTQVHDTPCPALDAFKEAFKDFRSTTIWLGGLAVTIVLGGWGTLWYQIGQAIERDHKTELVVNELQVRVEDNKIRIDEKFNNYFVGQAEILNNQKMIIAQLQTLNASNATP